MKNRLACVLAVAAMALHFETAIAVTVTAMEGGGPTPQQLAETIADVASGVSVVAGSATTAINNGFSTPSSPRAVAGFVNGLTAQGTQLPAVNGGSTSVTYAGGLGVSSGVCLSTGLITDSDAANPGQTGRGVGVEGPNNGISLSLSPGHISRTLITPITRDTDFAFAVFPNGVLPSGSGDPTVVQFNIQITSPGFLSVKTVFGSDEYDVYINAPYNDSFAILIKNECTQYENIAVLNNGGVLYPFTLQAIEACGPPHFKENQVAPQPTNLPTNPHAIDKNGDGVGNAADGVPHYDHEFGGFTSLRLWETKCPLAPGIYTVKFVVHDIRDTGVDSALFIQEDSLKLFAFLPGDFNLDGTVNGTDFGILAASFGMCDRKYIHGDANGDCCVDGADFGIMSANFGATGGNRNLKFDYNRDNTVDGTDFVIWQLNTGMVHCASRFEGDSDGDGDVDGDDNPVGIALADPCGGGGGRRNARRRRESGRQRSGERKRRV